MRYPKTPATMRFAMPGRLPRRRYGGTRCGGRRRCMFRVLSSRLQREAFSLPTIRICYHLCCKYHCIFSSYGSGLLVSLYRDLDLDDVADQEAPGLQSHIPVQAKVFAVDLRPGLEADGLRRTRHGHLSTSGELGIQHHFARDSSNRQVSYHLGVIIALWLNAG